MNNFYGYVVDKYSRFQKNENVLKIFVIDICGAPVTYCIRRVPAEWNWGTLCSSGWKEQKFDEDYSYQKIYQTYDEAESFVNQLIGGKIK